MNKDWSEKNKRIQELIGKKDTYKDGIKLLTEFRQEMFEQIKNIVNGFPEKAFYQMPYANAKGYHSKTLAYSIWHIFRIEDIVAHTLILGDEQIFFAGDYQKKTGAPIITTGNELKGSQIADFSKKLNIKELYEYAYSVMLSTNELLNKIDYWCDKDVRGLIKMQFCRHWIMHIEAMQRIKNKLCRLARKGVDPVAYCGFSCNHCFLGQWCGSCRTEYNCCSFATCFENKTCPNAGCCQEKILTAVTNVMSLKPVQKVFTLRKMMVQMQPRRRRCI